MNVLRDSQLPVSECWFQIGCELGVPLEIRRQQKTKALMTTDYWGALEECIDWWLRNNPDPSWEKLTSIIEKIDRCAAENMIRNTVKGSLLELMNALFLSLSIANVTLDQLFTCSHCIYNVPCF